MKPKLTLKQVRQIRVSCNSGKWLALTFGVHESTISRIRKGKTWNNEKVGGICPGKVAECESKLDAS